MHHRLCASDGENPHSEEVPTTCMPVGATYTTQRHTHTEHAHTETHTHTRTRPHPPIRGAESPSPPRAADGATPAAVEACKGPGREA
eukprot:9474522-Pyramimonas_sp.AAC.1